MRFDTREVVIALIIHKNTDEEVFIITPLSAFGSLKLREVLNQDGVNHIRQ